MTNMDTHVARTARLRDLLVAPGCAVAVGGHDPAIARLVERAGFEIAYMGSSASSAAIAGVPDVSLVTFSEMLQNARHIVNATTIPVLCDIDTGYGDTTIVKRAIREFEAAGAAGVHIEDQTFPKRCGQTTGASLVSVAEMTAKIYAAKEAQSDADFVLIARTDARQCEGLEGAIQRGRAYAAAGADAIFPEALINQDEFQRYRDTVPGPLVTDVPEWGRSPMLSVQQLEALGFGLALFAVSTLRVALGAVARFLADLRGNGTQRNWVSQMYTRESLDDLLGLSALRADESRLAEKTGTRALISTATPRA
jgi:methylisocitrate lyase